MNANDTKLSNSHYSVLFLFDGAAGSGKSQLMEYFSRKKCPIIKKYAYISDNAPSEIRDWNRKQGLIKNSLDEAEKARQQPEEFFHYSPPPPVNRTPANDPCENYIEHYWVPISTIEEALALHGKACMICRDFGVICKIKERFSNTKVVSIFVHSELILESTPEFDSDVENRLKHFLMRKRQAEESSYENIIHYDEVLLCFDDIASVGHPTRYTTQLDKLLQKYGQIPRGSVCLDSNNIVKLPVGVDEAACAKAQRQLLRMPFQRNVFVMIAYRDQTASYEAAINEVLKQHELVPVYAKDAAWSLTNHVSNSRAVLTCCKFGIAVLAPLHQERQLNPNVIYELGWMHALQRDCLITVQEVQISKLWHDLREWNCRPFKDVAALKEVVDNWCRGIIQK